MDKHLWTVARGDEAVLAALLRQRLRISQDEAESWVRGGCVQVAGRRCLDPAAQLRTGQRVTVYVPLPAATPRIVFQDADLLVLDKPAGLLSQPGPAGGPSVAGWLAERGDGKLLHRLDRGASGLMLAGRTAAARSALQQALVDHRIERRYLAVVHGHPAESGRIDLRIGGGGHALRRALPAASTEGKAAVTLFHTERRLGPGFSLLQVQIESGRTHQIRVHLSAFGHPLRGDVDYGAPQAERLYLHAASLRLVHPRTGARLCFDLPPPPDFLSWAGPGDVAG